VTARNGRPPGTSVAVKISVTSPAMSVARSCNTHRSLRKTVIPDRHFLEENGKPEKDKKVRNNTRNGLRFLKLSIEYDIPAPMNILEELLDRRRYSTLKWQRLKARFGRDDLLPMWVADADLPTVPEITEALIERARHPFYGYTFLPDSYREAVIGWYQNRHRVSVKPEWMIDMPGGVAAANFLFRTLLQKGDKILIHIPAYHCFPQIIRDGGYTLVTSKLRGSNFEIDLEELEQELKNGVKFVLICSPQNPVGRVWKRETLQRILELSMSYGVPLLVDEIFCDLVFQPGAFTSALDFPIELREQLIVFSSPMKTFNLAGLHISQLIVSNQTLRDKLRFERQFFGNEMPNAFGVIAGEVAYRTGERWLDAFLSYVRENMEILKAGLTDTPISFALPEATYLAWLDCQNLTCEDPFKFFTEELKIATSNGKLCLGERCVRLNVGCPRDTVVEAVIRMQAVL